MKKVLVINSSLQGESGNSNKASKEFIQRMQAQESISLTEIDLNSIDLPHLSAAEMQAWSTQAEHRSDEQQKLAAYSEQFVEAMKHADEIVLAIPMYNFGIPSTLKAFFDRIARAGVTFTYTENGPQGLLKDKLVTVLAARGGKYEGTALDTQSDYVKNFLNFLGLNNQRFYYIEGLAMGEDAAKQAWTKFSSQISEPNAI